ncbi:MAG: stage V sporulation protein D, partial [Oscillospiraceae bacterium]|nr:stage V sporulation protein D [Oscillospiraceae bacterium]
MAKGPNQRLWQRTIILMFILFGIGFTAIIVRLGYFQLGMGEELRQLAIDQQLKDTVISAKRGTIYDSNGDILAESASVWRVVLAPAYFENDEERAAITNELAKILDLDQQDLFEKSQQHIYYSSVKRQIESDKRAEILEFIDSIKVVDGKVKIAKELSAAEEELEDYSAEQRLRQTIELIDDYKRYYPYDRLGSAVLGFTGADDQGLEGLEAYYDDTLSGTPGRIITAKNSNGTDMPFQFEQNVEAQAGNNITLTIDARIQAIVEKYVTQAVNDNDVRHRAA